MRPENRNLLIGTIVGAIVGGTTAALLAPENGAETRVRMRKVADRARERATEITAKGREYYVTQKSQLQEAVEAGRHAAEEKRAELERRVREQTKTAAGRGV
jgi:gas vesicle protein